MKYTAIRALATYEICTVLFKMSLIDLFGISAHMVYLNHKSTTKIWKIINGRLTVEIKRINTKYSINPRESKRENQ